ncbi:MAG: RidA family protein [Nocardioidaceae bacterium]
MSLERINPDELASPSGFSHAVVAEGRHVYLAGQTATGPDGRIVGGDVVAQFDQALRNLLTALDAAGGRPDQLASVTIYIVDLDDYKGRARDIGGVWRELVGTTYPAMAGVGVPRLWDDAALVELQGVAVLD